MPTGEQTHKHQKFWMLYVEDGGKPNQTYLREESAMQRAEQLARITGKPVYVLEALRIVRPIMPETQAIPTITEIL